MATYATLAGEIVFWLLVVLFIGGVVLGIFDTFRPLPKALNQTSVLATIIPIVIIMGLGVLVEERFRLARILIVCAALLVGWQGWKVARDR